MVRRVIGSAGALAGPGALVGSGREGSPTAAFGMLEGRVGGRDPSRRPSSLPYLVCRSVKIASTAERITTGYRRRVRVVEAAILAARGVLKGISSDASASSVDIRVVGAPSINR